MNIYAKFTFQENIHRINSFSKAVCTDELYDIYYSGRTDINYIIAAMTIVGPILLLIVCASFIILGWISKKRKQAEKTKRKNLVALTLVGIYTTIYFLTLDLIAVNTVRNSKHEYAPELSVESIPFNLGVVYFTLAWDLLAFMILVFLLLLIVVIKCCKRPLMCCNTDSEDNIFPFLLIPPCMCFISHLGYIMLAWITQQPSRTTFTLLLYYFLFFYLFLIFRKSYKTGLKIKMSNVIEYSPDEKHSNTQSVTENTADSDSQTQKQTEQTSNISTNRKLPDKIDVCVFFVCLLLGIPYLGIAVVFIMILYIMPLASEDLFSYLFNVIQFMIVVVSTQFAYKLLVGKKFSIKKKF